MTYDLFFHNDFDGRASAAIFLDFLKKSGDHAEGFFPMDHFMAPEWDRLINRAKNLVAIFDFYFHPKAKFYFDHHPTTFINEDFENSFKRSKFHNLDFKFKSCASLVLDRLVKNFGYRPTENILELAEFADIVDAAEYSSPKEAVELGSPAVKLDAYIDAVSDGESLDWLIKLMTEEPVENILKLKNVKQVLNRVKVNNEKGVEFTKKNLQIYGKTVFLNLTLSRVPRVRFAPHYLYPDLVYVVTLMKDGSGYRISVGGNPWKPQSCKIDLGKYLKKNYGGGGHRRAAGIAGIKTREEGLKIVKELVQFLNK